MSLTRLWFRCTTCDRLQLRGANANHCTHASCRGTLERLPPQTPSREEILHRRAMAAAFARE